MRAVVEKPSGLNPALLLAISALSARFHLTADPETLKPDLWAGECMKLILTPSGQPQKEAAYDGNNYLGRPSVTAVQALNTLSFHFFGSGQSSIAWMVSGFAVRMAHALHLNDEFHRDPIGLNPNETAITFRDREIRRRTFWATFVMDRLNSAGENRPFTIRDDEINIQLPISQQQFDRDVPGVTQSLDGNVYNVPDELLPENTTANMDSLAYLVKIVAIWGEVTCFVQAAECEAQWAPSSTLMRLRAKVMFWADTLPMNLRYGSKPVQHPTWYLMHAAYFLALCVMHRFALPKGSRPYAIDHIPPAFLIMCVKTSIDNAGKLGELIQSIPPNVKVAAPFMGYAAFSAATLHAFLGYHVPDMPQNKVQQYRQYVQSSLAYLKELGKAWTPVCKMHEALASQILVRCKSQERQSILHGTGTSTPTQFRVPDSQPISFSTQQQIEMNTMLFSNWFNNPTTQNYFDPTWNAGQPVFSDSMQEQLVPRQPSLPVTHDEAPYGIPIPRVSGSETTDEAADLLVYFQSRPHDSVASGRSHAQLSVEIDFLGNLREARHSVAVDILQLMKVGVITSDHWS